MYHSPHSLCVLIIICFQYSKYVCLIFDNNNNVSLVLNRRR
jgi:hypothetical protein